MFLKDEEKTNDDLSRDNKRIGETTKQLKGLERATQITSKTFTELSATLKENLTDIGAITTATAQLEQLSFKVVRETMGQGRIMGEAVRDTIADAAFESAQYGLTLDDNFNVMSDINSVMKRNTLLTTEQTIGMGLLARNAGITSKEVAEMVEGFDTLGIGTDKAISNISDMQKQARTYGLNVGEFMKSVGSNVKLLASYNFKNGVEGFSKMVAKAQSLRIDFNKVVSMADSLMDPEKSIEMAAGFQMLGGAVGDLGDPFKLLNMAQNDVGGLQDAIIGMAEGAAVFNEKTGEFDIPVTEMYRLREAARLTGMDYQELTETAIKSAEKTRKLDMLGPMSRYTDEQKELIANMAEIDDAGQLKINVPGIDGLQDASNLSAEQLDILAEQQEKAKMSDKEIAISQLDALTAMVDNTENLITAIGVRIGTNTKGVTDTIEAGGEAGKQLSSSLDTILSEENVKKLGTSVTDLVASGFKSEEARSAVKQSIGTIFKDAQTELGDFAKNISLNLDNDNILKDFNTLDQFQAIISKFGMTGSFLSENGAVGSLNSLQEATNKFYDNLISIDRRIGRKNERTDESTVNENDDINIDLSTLDFTSVDDFIIRPNEEVLKFNPNDIVIGGTDLMGENQNTTLEQTPIRFNENNPIIDENKGNLNNQRNVIDRLSDLVMNSFNTETSIDTTPKEIKLVGDGEIKVNISGNQTQIDIRELLQNPDFVSGIVGKITNRNNSYSS
jgi:hypothetical protein